MNLQMRQERVRAGDSEKRGRKKSENAKETKVCVAEDKFCMKEREREREREKEERGEKREAE